MLIYANPSHRPRRARGTSKKGPTMAKKKRARKATSRRRRTIHRNPTHSRRASSRRASSHKRRRRVHRNPFTVSSKGIIGEITSRDGLMMLAAAAVAPVTVNTICDKILPIAYNTGWYKLAARTAVTLGIGYVIDKYAKQRKVALGFVAGSAGSILYDAYTTYRAGAILPPGTPPAVADEIARNPTLFEGVMNGTIDGNSLNGYDVVPMAGYDVVPMADDFESYN